MGFSEFIVKTTEMLWFVLATLTYVLIEMAITELGALSIHKRTFFKKTEWFVLSTILFAIVIFSLGSLLQNIFVSLLIQLKGWLFLIVLFLLSLDILILSKFTKGRTWKFRLVIASIIVMAIIIIFCIILLIIHFIRLS